jgi:hypothetical protein
MLRNEQKLRKESFMKNLVKLFGIIALVAVIGLSFVACGDDDGGGGGNEPTSTVYESTDGENDYKLEIKKAGDKAAYAPQPGDSYILTITNITYKTTQTSEGKVTGVSGGFTLKPANSEVTFAIKIEGDLMNGITGTITLTNGETKEPPESFSPVKNYNELILMANMWDNEGADSGESMFNLIELSDFTTRKPKSGDVLKFRISGTIVNTIIPLKWFRLEIHNYKGELFDNWSEYQWIGISEIVELSETFQHTFEINVYNDTNPDKIISLSLSNSLWFKNPDGIYLENNDKLPAGIQRFSTVAIFSNFRIALLPE